MAAYNMDRETGILLQVSQLPELSSAHVLKLMAWRVMRQLTWSPPDHWFSSVIFFNPQIIYTNKKWDLGDKQASKQHCLVVPLSQFLPPGSCPGFPSWWIWKLWSEINPYLPKLILVMVFYHSQETLTKTPLLCCCMLILSKHLWFLTFRNEIF